MLKLYPGLQLDGECSDVIVKIISRVRELIAFVALAVALSDWGKLQAQVLFESVPMWRKEPYVIVAVWQEKFKHTVSRATTRSVDAFKGYLRVGSLEDLGNASGASVDGC
jgi:hypothetical protein